MKMENKREAQERRAIERKRKQQAALIRRVAIIVVIVAAVGGLIGYGVYDSKHNTTANQATENTQSVDNTSVTDNTSATLNTDTSLEVVNGDTVNIHYVGSVDGVEFQGGTGDYDLEIGSGTFIPGFEEQLVGAHVGDTVDVKVTFPEGYRDSADADGNKMVLSGADAVFTVTINGIYK
jgi:trigger factor